MDPFYFSEGWQAPIEWTSYDRRGRIETVTTLDGEHNHLFTQYTYQGRSMMVEDPDNKTKKTMKDNLGRVVEVTEHGDVDSKTTLESPNLRIFSTLPLSQVVLESTSPLHSSFFENCIKPHQNGNRNRLHRH